MKLNNIKDLFMDSIDAEPITSKQKDVLKASLILFAEKGFDSTSTRDIASLAEVSEGTVYKRFKTKDEIMANLLNPFIQKVIPSAFEQFSQKVSQQNFDSLEAFLSFTIPDRFYFFKANKYIVRVFIQEILKNPQHIESLTNNINANLKQYFEPVFLNLKRNKQLVDWSTDRCFRYIISTLFSYVLPFIIANKYEKFDIDRITQESVEFLTNGLTPR